MKSPLTRYLYIPGLRLRVYKPRWFFSLPLISALVVLVSALDYFLGSEPEFSIFYLVPITAAVFLMGAPAGVVTSLISAGAWIAADLLTGETYTQVGILIWDDCVQLVFFLLHTLLISWLLRVIREVRMLSLHDPLTGAANWRYFEEYAHTRFRVAIRSRTPVTFAFFDLDNFKKINDTFGHETGNALLRIVADTVREEIRPDDTLVRLGGDEFGLLLTDSENEDVRTVLSRIFSMLNRKINEKKWPVTFSVGAVTYRRPPDSLNRMISEADQLMYQVKNSGKNDILHEERP